MKSDEVITLARSLMVKHGVGHLQFGFHHYSTRPGVVGQAHTAEAGGVKIYSKITLDANWIKILPEFKVREVMLHEIAHTLTPIYLNMNPHHGEWKKKCIELGIDPEARFRWHTSPQNSGTKVLDR